MRQVCSEWMIEADHKLKDKVSVKIFCLDQLKRFVNEISEDGIYIVSHYHIEGLNLNRIEASNFLNKFGPTITSLSINFCDWKSTTFRISLFKKLPNLTSLEVSSKKNCGQLLECLMPMNCLPYGSFVHLNNMRELRIQGDFSNRTDLFYDILKSSPNLRIIHLSKYHQDNDDLFGTWFVEIILSCQFSHLSSLEVECTLIQQQVDLLSEKAYPLRRLSIDLEMDAVDNKSIDKILGHFPLLESVEIGVDNVPPSTFRNWKHIHSCSTIQNGNRVKVMFPKHASNNNNVLEP